MSNNTKPSTVQTTGHSWDGDLQEYNNPLPRWWLWSFYATAVFCVVYWLMYPAWPFANTWTTGLKTVTFEVDGAEKTMRWNTRAELQHEMDYSTAAMRQQEWLQKINAASFDDIIQDPDMLAFARSAGKGLFGDNCAACHGRGGQGVMSLYPNLADDAWLWGGTMAEIEQTLYHGRNGYMPAFDGVLDQQQLADVSEYVLSLSGEAQVSETTERGEAIFQGPVGGCYQCHGRDGQGLASQGSANLTDKIWTLANVQGQRTLEGKRSEVSKLIWEGVIGRRVMPAWNETTFAEVSIENGDAQVLTNGSRDRLKPEEIKLLAVYVHQLGGGQ